MFLPTTVQMGDNSREFSALVEEGQSEDERGIHPPPVQAVDSSGRTATVLGDDLPMSRQPSSDAAERLIGLPFASLRYQINNCGHHIALLLLDSEFLYNLVIYRPLKAQ